MGRLARADTDPLNEQQKVFIARYLETGDAVQASLDASYSSSNPGANAWRLLRLPNVSRAVALQARQRFAGLAPVALHVIEMIMLDTAVAARVRLEAAKTLLDRAGYIAPKAQQERSNDLPLHEMSTDDLRTMAARLEDEIAGRARPISAIPAPDSASEDDPAVDLLG